MFDLSALQEQAGQSLPMGGESVHIIQGRTLYIDGDGLAYNCAGNEETTVGEARARVREKVEAFRRAASADKVVILLTGSGSHKGHRYAVARAKAYQGGRSNSRRPNNWAALRSLLEANEYGDVTHNFFDREADDAFAQYGWANPEGTAIATQDKDMRMVPGYHVDWKDNRIFYLAPGTYDAVFNDKQFGMKWFWLQMLHGDATDGIPGVPKAYGKLCGEVGAAKILAEATNNAEAAALVAAAYESYYADEWRTALLEQAVLLWMRRGEDALWSDCLQAGGPLEPFTHEAALWPAIEAIASRIQEAQEINDLAATQDN